MQGFRQQREEAGPDVRLLPAVRSRGEARAPQLVAGGCPRAMVRGSGGARGPLRSPGLRGGTLSVTAGFLPSPVQSHPLHPPAVVLHHDLQRGEALPEEQAAPEGECAAAQGRAGWVSERGCGRKGFMGQEG